jgi:hypothetical protein
MDLLSIDQILDKDDKSYKEVYVDAWGGTVRVASLTSAQRDDWEAQFVKNKNKPEVALKKFRARLVAKCLVDAEGRLLFDSKEKIDRLASKNASVLNELFEICQQHNGFTDADVEELEGK